MSHIPNDLFNFLLSEDDNRPSPDYLENVQERRITPDLRAICIDLFICVAEKIPLSSDTIHLAINCWERYLSRHEVDDFKNVCLSGVTCLIIASKYHEIKDTFELDKYVILLKDDFSRSDFIEMEVSILNYLDNNVVNPTAWSFLERSVRAAKVGKQNPLYKLESLTSYIAELSLLSYAMLPFRPSLVAASCVFLALRVLCPSEKRPWTDTLQNYTGYRVSELGDCVRTLHRLCYKIQILSMPNVRIKYSQDKYGGVGLTYFSVFLSDALF